MNIQEIQQLPESQTFDCKSIQIDPKALAIPLVAMANADGGVIAVGISDKTRRIEGIDNHTDKLNELLRVPYDYCKPSVKAKVEYLPCVDENGNENHVLLINVPASGNLHTNQADEAFMRVGDKSKKHGSAIPTFHLDAFILKATLKAEWTNEEELDRPSTVQVTAQLPPNYRPTTAQLPPKLKNW